MFVEDLPEIHRTFPSPPGEIVLSMYLISQSWVGKPSKQTVKEPLPVGTRGTAAQEILYFRTLMIIHGQV